MIENSCIQEILDRADIVEVASALIPGLKSKSGGLTGKSPFVDEKTGSFHVSASKQIFKCFSSGKGGGVVTLVNEIKNFGLVDTMHWLADFYKIEMRYEDNGRSKEDIQAEKDRYSTADKILRSSLKQWRDVAQNSPDFKAYCEKRGITQEDVIQWNIAQAPNEWRYLTPKIVDKGLFNDSEEIGIVTRKDDSNYDVYRNRIIFPIHSTKGNLIGFAGRDLSDDKDTPKYINPKESFIYDKSKVLYGWHFAVNTIRKTKRVRLVEGYLDVIALHRVGLTTAIAPCGTALTSGQAQIIAKAANAVGLTMDGDAAGIKSMQRIIPILLKEGLEVFVSVIPDGKDPDDLVKDFITSNPKMEMKEVGLLVKSELEAYSMNAIDWMMSLSEGKAMTPREKAEFNKSIAELIAMMPDEDVRDEYIKATSKQLGLTVSAFKKLVNGSKQKAQSARKSPASEEMEWDHLDDEEEWFPEWAKPLKKEIKKNLLVQKDEGDGRWPIGIYFPPVSNNAPVFKGLERVTNFTIKPLYQVIDERNGRWLAELWNGDESNTVELQDGALVEQSLFLKTLVPKRCYSYPKFAKFHFQYISAMLMNETKKCFELKTLGHQPEDFFAFSNAVLVEQDGAIRISEYDELGIVSVKDKNYLSSGVSNMRGEQRGDDDMYENDLYLKYVKTEVKFREWAKIFMKVFDDHGAYGLSFIFLSIYKDMIYKIGGKCPLLYLYGPKGSGKSAMGESIMFFFFSGKNTEGRLIQAVNMSPGMVTDFALASALQRFRNLPRLYNEYDPNSTDLKYRGWFKAAFDGEGRERGMGDSGGKRKTEIMKVQGTVMLAGQYMDTGDDGAVMTRAINLQFSEEKNKNRTEEQKDLYRKLHEMEASGLSGCIAELIKIRPYVWSKIKQTFYSVKKNMSIDAKAKKGGSIEERLLNNYALCYSFCEVVNDVIKLPLNLREFYTDCIERMVQLSAFISEGSVVNRFWDVMENLIDTGILKYQREFDITTRDAILIRHSEGNEQKTWPTKKQLLLVRINSVYGPYAKEVRSRGQRPMDQSVIETYLKDAPYFVGLCPRYFFSESNNETSAYVLDYELMLQFGLQVGKEKLRDQTMQPNQTIEQTSELVDPTGDDLPF